MSADWIKAPEGAMWHTVDAVGTGEWWTKKPTTYLSTWQGPTRGNDGQIGEYIHGEVHSWRDTLEARPAASESDEPHAENKWLYRIDEAVFGVDEAPKYWQTKWYDRQHWATCVKRPKFDGKAEYRRDPSAPPQPSEDWANAPDWAEWSLPESNEKWWADEPLDVCGRKEPRPPQAWFALMRGEPKADADGWVEWPGGDMPVDGETLVDVRFKGGRETFEISAIAWVWEHNHYPYDIIAYRLSKSQTHTDTQGDPDSDSHDDGVLTGAELHRAIADAMDAGEGPEVFEWQALPGGTFRPVVSWNQAARNRIRRKPITRHAYTAEGERIEWPAPMIEAPGIGTRVWLVRPDLDDGNDLIWEGHAFDLDHLNNGLVQATREGSVQHRRALIAISRGSTDAY